MTYTLRTQSISPPVDVIYVDMNGVSRKVTLTAHQYVTFDATSLSPATTSAIRSGLLISGTPPSNYTLVPAPSAVTLGALLANNNLSDLSDKAVARTNLGLGGAATAALDTDVTLASNSDVKAPSQKAIKAYVDSHASAVDGVAYKRGSAPITNGQQNVVVVFTTPFSGAPSNVQVTLRLPSNGDLITYGVDGSTITANGFTAKLAAPVPNGSYQLDWKAEL